MHTVVYLCGPPYAYELIRDRAMVRRRRSSLHLLFVSLMKVRSFLNALFVSDFFWFVLIFLCDFSTFMRSRIIILGQIRA